jgi:hypothetical protein
MHPLSLSRTYSNTQHRTQRRLSISGITTPSGLERVREDMCFYLQIKHQNCIRTSEVLQMGETPNIYLVHEYCAKGQVRACVCVCGI